MADQAIRVLEKAAHLDALNLSIVQQTQPACPSGYAIVKVKAAAVNPSDVKATLGIMPQAVFPRTPGRDFAGVVVDGPSANLGMEVWGSAGDTGITKDGSHGQYLVLPVAALQRKPQRLSFDEAGSVGVPFVTAYEGFRRSGLPQAHQTVVVMGANGKVGQAAIQLAAQAGAKVIAVQRQSGPFEGFAAAQVLVIDARSENVADQIRELSGGKGADIVFNTVGSPYFDTANKAMAKGATQILISTVEKPTPFDIFAFYRGMHTFVGIDTLDLDCVASCERLQAMHDGFEAGTLRAFPLSAEATYDLSGAQQAYRRVLSGDSQRIVLRP
jgi:NADPH:quinone reductase